MSVPRLEIARSIVCFRRWSSFAFFHWIRSPSSIKWLCSCMWQRWDENQHYQNWGTSSFSVFIASEWSITETGGEVQVYLGIVFTSDGRQDEELDTSMGKASAVMRALQYSVVMKRELLKKAKLSVFKTVFVPNPRLWSWVLDNDRKNTIASASVRNEIFAKNRRSYVI